MKLHLFIVLIGILWCSACSENEHHVAPNEAIIKAFTTKYPHATQIKWETKNSYMKAEFINNEQSCTAWFVPNGQWHMTETEFYQLYQLPESIQAAFTNSDYATYKIDEITHLERLDSEDIYILEVEKGKVEYALCYSKDGILIKALPDNDEEDYENYLPPSLNLPETIIKFINTKYPDARIVESEREKNQIEVDIIHQNRSKEVIFNNENQWLHTHYDVHRAEVENKVLETLSQSVYKDYFIDDIEKIETPSGESYLFELEKGNEEIKITIDLNGNLTSLH